MVGVNGLDSIKESKRQDSEIQQQEEIKVPIKGSKFISDMQ